MAAGSKDEIYVTDAGTAALIRLSKADKAVTGNVAGTGATNGMRIYNRRSSRRVGIQPRRIVLSRLLRAGVPAGGVPDQYAYRYVTILTKAAWDAYTKGDDIEYEGQQWEVDRKQPETTNS